MARSICDSGAVPGIGTSTFALVCAGALFLELKRDIHNALIGTPFDGEHDRLIDRQCLGDSALPLLAQGLAHTVGEDPPAGRVHHLVLFLAGVQIGQHRAWIDLTSAARRDRSRQFQRIGPRQLQGVLPAGFSSAAPGHIGPGLRGDCLRQVEERHDRLRKLGGKQACNRRRRNPQTQGTPRSAAPACGTLPPREPPGCPRTGMSAPRSPRSYRNPQGRFSCRTRLPSLKRICAWPARRTSPLGKLEGAGDEPSGDPSAKGCCGGRRVRQVQLGVHVLAGRTFSCPRNSA